MGYGVSFWKSPHGKHIGWRLSIALQYIPAAIFCAGVLFMPETYVHMHLNDKKNSSDNIDAALDGLSKENDTKKLANHSNTCVRAPSPTKK